MNKRFASIVARYPESNRPRGGVDSLGSAGGLSGAELFVFDSAAGRLVLRALPVGGPGIEHYRYAHDRLFELRGLRFIAQPLAAIDGRTLQVDDDGRIWELAPWLEGSPERANPPAEARVRSAFEATALVHDRWRGRSKFAPSPGLEARIRTLDDWTSRGFVELEQALQHINKIMESRGFQDETLAREEMDLANTWIQLARRSIESVADRVRPASIGVTRLQPCLRDLRPEHFLFTGNETTGLVDYGAIGVDSIAADLARLLGEWIAPGDPLRASALDAYRSIATLETSDLALIEAFEIAGDFLQAGEWAKMRFLEARTFGDRGAVKQGLVRGIARLSRRLEANPDWLRVRD